MLPGDRAGGRWALTAPVPSAPDLERWRAVGDDGAPVEVVRPRIGTLDRGYRGLLNLADPGLVRTLAVTDDGWVVRDTLEDPDGTVLRGAMDPGEVAAIGARLFPAVVAAGQPLSGLFRPDDVGIRADGSPVLAPKPRAKGAVSGKDARFVAPEMFAGNRPDGAAALYGLGVWLYRLATGIDPAQSPATPSAIRRGVPPALDRAILALLSREPTERASALPHLQASAGALPDLRVAPPPKIEGVRVTTTGGGPQSRGRADVADAGWQVVIPPATLARLTPEERSLAAGFAEVPLATVEEVLGASLPLVLYSGRSRPEAAAKAQELQTLTRLPVSVVSPIGCLPWALLGVALATAPVAAAMLFFGPIVMVIASIVPFVLLLLAVAVLVSRSGAARQASRARELLMRAARDPVTAPVRARIAQLRRRFRDADLPAAIAIDLRGGLADIERHLDGLAQVHRIAEEALSRMDLGKLRAKRDSLPPDQGAERDRLARAIVDLEEVQARRDRVAEEIARVDASLDELEAVIGRTGGDAPTEDVVGRVLKRARIAASTDVMAPPAPIAEKS